ncbi:MULTISPECIES: AAA family ATPase [Thermococcus]|uniref:AAA family ATPase n=1 Tax=Thermococcus TaxID=2263 RepID=UPI000B34D9EF|nr:MULTISPECIES: ATP-binding protein [Thermococcus]MCA6212803.1 ATP-binding protein [Thermococcus bergensis]
MFSTRPVREEKNLHGGQHREAVKKLRETIEDGDFVAVLGPRRVGKTSVINVFLNKYGSKYRYLYYDLAFGMGREAISYTELTPVSTNISEEELEYSATLNLGLVKMDIKPRGIAEFQNAFINLLRYINSQKKKTVVIFDEAQVLPRFAPLSMLGMLQTISDSFENVTVVLSGSMPGLLERIINPTEDRPFFARYVERINIPRWDIEESVEYLKKGLPDAPEEELKEAAKELSNVPGFLAYYGKLRTKGKTHEEALSMTVNYGVKLWKEDLKNFIRIYKSPAYIIALRTIAKGPSYGVTTEEVVTEITSTLKISERRAKEVLKNLIDGGFLVKPKRGIYQIPERPLRKAVLEFKVDVSGGVVVL